MKALLLFTVLLCSNTLASPVDLPPSEKPRLTSPPSNEPIHINDLPADILNQRILARVDWPSRRNFKLTDKQNSKTVILTNLFDKFLQICQSHRYLACWKYARYLLKESTGEFARKNLLQEALQRAVKEGNAWAVSALSDVVEFSQKSEQNFYFGVLGNYLKKQKSNQDLITLDVLRRKSRDLDPGRAWGMGYLVGFITTNYPPHFGLAVAAIKDAIKISDHEQVYTLLQAFNPEGLREAGILSYACEHGDQFAAFYVTKDFVMERKKEEQFSSLRDESKRRQLEEENSSREEKSSELHDAYKQAIIFGNEDAVEFFQQFHGMHRKKKVAKRTPRKGKEERIEMKLAKKKRREERIREKKDTPHEIGNFKTE